MQLAMEGSCEAVTNVTDKNVMKCLRLMMSSRVALCLKRSLYRDGMPNSWQEEATRAAVAEDRPVFPMKLVYFNVRGVVEVARYMLHMGGAEYEDFRYPFDESNYAKPASAQPRIASRARASRGRVTQAAGRAPNQAGRLSVRRDQPKYARTVPCWEWPEREREKEREREIPREPTGGAAARSPALPVCISPPTRGYNII